MKTIKYSTQFKKDFKKYRNNKKKVEKLLKCSVCLRMKLNYLLNIKPIN